MHFLANLEFIPLCV